MGSTLHTLLGDTLGTQCAPGTFSDLTMVGQGVGSSKDKCPSIISVPVALGGREAAQPWGGDSSCGLPLLIQKPPPPASGQPPHTQRPPHLPTEKLLEAVVPESGF